MPVSIVEQDGRLAVNSPYHPNFPARARLLGGDWDVARRVWIFDAREDDRVRSLCREIYGTDGTDGIAPLPSVVEHGRKERAALPRRRGEVRDRDEDHAQYTGTPRSTITRPGHVSCV